MSLTKYFSLVALWLLSSLGTALLLAGLLLGFDALQSPQLDIQTNNVYFVVQRTSIVALLMIPMLLVVGFVLALFTQRSVQKHVFLATVGAVTIGLTNCFFFLMPQINWTIYPPLDATSDVGSPDGLHHLVLIALAVMIILQLLAILMLGYNSYQVGKLATR